MIKFEHTDVYGWEHAIRGMRNPLESHDKSDSDCVHCMGFDPSAERDCKSCDIYIGPNDHSLMMRLSNSGRDHRKFMRMLVVYVDITAPLYWWKEFDTYKVGTVANSYSTMHCIHKHEFTLADFSTDHLIEYDNTAPCCEDCRPYDSAFGTMGQVVNALNVYRDKYIKAKNATIASLVKELGFDAWDSIPGDTDEVKRSNLVKKYWWQMIQLLPSSYNQKRTIMLNYEVLANIYHSRKDHKLDEWRKFCAWIEELPNSEIIIGHYTDEPKEEEWF